MITADNIFREVLELKNSANAKKNRSRYPEAIETFSEAIQKINTFLFVNKEDLQVEQEGKLNDELADCYGQIGGVYKRWAFTETDESLKNEKLKFSYESYDSGYAFEKQGTKLTSYNLLNRLVIRIFFNPQWLNKDSNDSAGREFLLKELLNAQQEIQEQMKTREDIWGWADLGLVAILLNSETPVAAFDAFLKRVRNSQDYNSLIDTLKPLSLLPIDAKENLSHVIRFLEKNIS